MILVSIALLTGHFAEAAAAADARPVSVENLRQALAVAKLAAKNKLPDLSLRAVRNSLAAGPPVQPLQFEPGQPTSSRSGSQQDQEYQQYINEVESSLSGLSREWERQGFDPEQVFQTLAAVVLPEGRPTEIFLYTRSEANSNEGGRAVAGTSSGSVGSLLIEWALRAKQTARFQELVRKRAESPRARFDSRLLLVGLAVKQNDPAAAAGELEQLREAVKTATARNQSESAGLVALQALKYPELRPAAVELLEAACTKLQAVVNTQNTLEPIGTWLKTAATTRLQLGAPEAARRNYQAFLTAHDAYYSRYPADYAVQNRRRELQSIARDMLRFNQLLEAFQLLGEQADLSLFDSTNAPTTLAASLARQLRALAPAERYDFLLKWTIPTQPGAALRLMTGFIPSERPPQEFVTALPTKQRPHGFETVRSTPALAVFHSGAALLVAAEECGKTDELLEKLKMLREAKTPNAEILLRLARLRTNEAPQLQDELQARIAWLEDMNKPDSKSGAQLTAMPLDDFVTALFAIEHQELRETGKRLLLAGLAHAKRLQQSLARSHLWAAYVTAVNRDRNAEPASGAATPVSTPAFKHWVQVGFDSPDSRSAGSTNPLWVADGFVVRNLMSAPLSALFLRYPLKGKFEFSTSISEGDWNEGTLLYGGLSWQTYRYGNQVVLSGLGRSGRRTGPLSVLRDASSDSDCTIRVDQEQAEYFVNGHKVFTENCGQGSPWLGLRSTEGLTPVFRSIHFAGNVEIPREVPLLADARLLGWSPALYRETATDVLAAPNPSSRLDEPEHDWSWNEGVLTGRRRRAEPAASQTALTESYLSYQRPLCEGEQIRYQFFYEPESTLVHSTLDRLAFVIQPNGVRLHWLTDGAGEWTGLPADNLADDPSGQQARGPLPMKPQEWNTLVVSRRQGSIALALNGTPIYSRSLPPDAAGRFGFYHHREREEARVREVVLSGDWPRELPRELSNAPFALREAVPPSRARVNRELIEEEYLSRDALRVLRDGAALPIAERWQHLLRWVFPEDSNVKIRLRGEFVPANDPLAAASAPQLVAPALALVETARALNRLSELEKRVTSMEAAKETYDFRARLALQAIILLASGKPEVARAPLKELYASQASTNPNSEWERWPELLAAEAAMQKPETNDQAVLLLDHIVDQYIRKQKVAGAAFNQRAQTMRGLARTLAMTGGSVPSAAQPLESREWLPVSHSQADTVALGIAEPVWLRTPAGFRHVAGHADVFLYYRTPLTGDFEVDFVISGFGYREVQLMYAGRRVGLKSTRNETALGNFTTTLPNGKLPAPIRAPSGWFPGKLAVKGGRMTFSVNDQSVFAEDLPANADPWFAFHCRAESAGDIRHVKISGAPMVPERLDLTAAGNLHGWVATFYGENASGTGWGQNDGEIVGFHDPQLAGSGKESLLQYHRPLAEDGELSYRFRYVPGQAHVHPALGRTVFLLEPDGVRLHDRTCGNWEMSGLSPTNSRAPDEAAVLRPIPLRADAENEAKLLLAGETLSIVINGEPVYRGPIPADKNRLFGLFHWAGETQARVKNVAYRGDWPKQLPPVAEQEAARVAPSFFSSETNRLSASLAHDFTRDGLGKNLFTRRAADADALIQLTPEGVTVTCVGMQGWRESALSLRPQLVGDFDISATFDNYQVESLPAGSAAVGLQLTTSGLLAIGPRMARRTKADGEQILESVLSYDGAEGKRAYVGRDALEDAKSGTFRIVRRGGLLHYFLKSEPVEEWRYFDTIALGQPNASLDALSLQTTVTDAKDKRASVRWKSLEIRVEEIRQK